MHRSKEQQAYLITDELKIQQSGPNQAPSIPISQNLRGALQN